MVLSLVRKLTGSSSRKPTLRYFDEAYYLREYPEVSEHELSPLEHFLLFGWKLRYDPSAEFSTQGYLDANPDVIGSKISPLIHFLQHGKAEGRKGWQKGGSNA